MGTIRKMKRRARLKKKLPLFGMSRTTLIADVGVAPQYCIGETIAAPPGVGHTQTFISIGSFDTREEAEACNKYVNTKFARALLSVKKVTQDNSPATWEFVPMQDFTAASDIDWTQSLAGIDKQLYRKYKLTWEEIAFIEGNFKYRAIDRADEKPPIIKRKR